jgi:hypothetical protein
MDEDDSVLEINHQNTKTDIRKMLKLGDGKLHKIDVDEIKKNRKAKPKSDSNTRSNKRSFSPWYLLVAIFLVLILMYFLSQAQ